MKKILVIGMLFFAFNNSTAQTQVVKVNPLGLLFGIANAGYEFTTTGKQTATISGLYFNVSDITGAGAGLDYQFYFGEQSIRGWHAGPSVSYFSLSDNTDVSASVFSIGGVGGYQWVFGEHFALDLFGGISFSSGGEDLTGFNATGGVFGVSLGYAW
ncbi:MAG: DUF3575 domain-containing protein [Flavobacteriia bacterium]|nr:DUF3575 domain-containing protein [Flavobacteriia bacterium]OIP46528.1 MAG: hypothetical protein AUK46_08280 [Flavobacteriaceae bacterium CG2_30_31_66]PIV96469.1 MAG: hypothetical protein COW43_08125 [Flavobacteriaceae bacterium CG17_big_fil_post_rev_8_21_14_2_50_31_13]PIX13165.1 MAG: hypothetical protein COZ74_07715 [Flavobacteriaceae bacterium CG_4_8_14_3_um_filter_31_8]PIY15091.1 MAG: hypothetical protein COZ16_05780 [Flavobacteriaceae bacterium CG_4_10_14_3_um_filter_31_253]PIZ09731.1 M